MNNSEQHSMDVFCPDFVTTEETCRSEPARDSGVSVNAKLPDRQLSRAGSLLQGIA